MALETAKSIRFLDWEDDAVYDPVKLAIEISHSVLQGKKRKYYRLSRGGGWYGGIATSDCLGCQLMCCFCWSGQRDRYRTSGTFYSPSEVVHALIRCAEKNRYRQLRLSGNEPTLGREHLIEILSLLKDTRYLFILETNGLLIDDDFAAQLSGFRNLRVRVSLKGANEEEFGRVTGAPPEYFNLQLEALKNLKAWNVACHPACMLSFSTPDSKETLRSRLHGIDPKLALHLEEEYIILYPHVEEKLKRARLTPAVALTP